jgi:hypothetical protein
MTTDTDWIDVALAGTGVSGEGAGELARGAAPSGAAEAGLAPALVAGWQMAAGADPQAVVVADGSVELFDLGMRLRAAATGQCQPRLAHRVAVGEWPMVAVRVQGKGSAAVVSVERPGQAVLHGPLGCVLTSLVPDDTGPECLVVASRSQLRRLVGLAIDEAEGGPHDSAAARLGWWGQRAEHPGSAAVVVVADDCRQRWVTGAGPEAESDADTWAAWLGTAASRPTASLLATAGILRTGTMLATLGRRSRPDGEAVRGGDEGREGDDARSWDAFVRSPNARWRAWDSPRAAAIGLRSRSDAADFFARVLLDDPTWAVRARFEGRVVAATVDSMSGVTVRLVAHQSACRHRPGSKIVLRRSAGAALTADLGTAAVGSDGRLVLDVETARNARSHLSVGERVEVVSPPVSLGSLVRGRTNLASRYALPAWTRDRGATAPDIRREVPLDVLVAAADD